MPTNLSTDDLRHIAARLTAEADALRVELSAAESQMTALSADCDLDAGDASAKTAALDRLRRDTERARTLLDQVVATLPRVGAPGFGRCAFCGDVIGRDRLLAVPHTELCIVCARAGAGTPA
ncbi:TraR/DksA family transcriptional regulator [Streptomyces yaanensis]|uniref:TraR/DksA family transcriptional regulator n=1 Tax=Streptomyces yaanensis TaxID=1142239 RepID=A0ABV7S8X5_9ACTN|nr:TraR/DksA C4-type zinc finger protein [Streptomyces sp. CGMCC 4.7035]WNC00129.1 TraR/DksA C4-type zinc finger protein [Streptomyces sp. CGMCC 4.7035]